MQDSLNDNRPSFFTESNNRVLDGLKKPVWFMRLCDITIDNLRT
ncbi:394_t:CDS:1, partial [Dentiscutata heterogama]